MKRNELGPAYNSLILIVVIFFAGVLGYMIIERWDFLDSLYMTISTIATVGIGEVRPLSSAGKIFTSALIILSFGTFAYAATTLVQYIVNGVFRNYFKYSKVKKEIEQLSQHVIVVGYGRNGHQSIDELKHHNIPLVVIENREAKIKEIQQRNDLLYIDDDPSSDEVLINAGIKKAKALISVLPTDEENLFVVITAHELNPKLTIISRAINYNTVKKLKTAGATRVIMPDKISGQHMASMIAHPDTVEFMDYLMLDKQKTVSLEEVSCKGVAENPPTTIKQLKKQENINIIGLKKRDGSYIVNPEQDLILNGDDMLFVLGKHYEIQLFIKSMHEKEVG
ncbi:MAG TPA: potassium channel family protein [Bacteroidales bacterium]